MADQIKLNQSVYTQKVGEELIILDMESGKYFELNETGRLIVQGIEKGLSQADIAESITSQFEVDLSTAITDVKQICSQLAQHGLIVPSL